MLAQSSNNIRPVNFKLSKKLVFCSLELIIHSVGPPRFSIYKLWILESNLNEFEKKVCQILSQIKDFISYISYIVNKVHPKRVFLIKVHYKYTFEVKIHPKIIAIEYSHVQTQRVLLWWWPQNVIKAHLGKIDVGLDNKAGSFTETQRLLKLRTALVH